MIKSSIEKHTVGWLKRKNRDGLLNFSITIQRKEVWDLVHKSNLVVAVLLGVPVESLLFEEEKDGKGYKVLDGQQRDLAFLRFINDEFAISDKVKVSVVDGVNVVGKKFSELPQSMQDDILDYELSISVMRPLTDEEREIVFFMRNQAVALTKFELTRVNMGSRVLEELKDLVEHPFFEKIALSASALRSYENQRLVLQCLILDMEKDLSFSGKDVDSFGKSLKDEPITNEVRENMLRVFNYLNEAIPGKNKSLRKIHIPMLYAQAKQALNDKVLPAKFNQWVEKFFEDLLNLKEIPMHVIATDLDPQFLMRAYEKACKEGSAKKSNIRIRLENMKAHYEKSIKEILEGGNE